MAAHGAGVRRYDLCCAIGNTGMWFGKIDGRTELSKKEPREVGAWRGFSRPE